MPVSAGVALPGSVGGWTTTVACVASEGFLAALVMVGGPGGVGSGRGTELESGPTPAQLLAVAVTV